MLVCVPTMPGFDDFEIEADCVAEACEKAEDYCLFDEYGEGTEIDYRRQPYVLSDTGEAQ